MTLQAQGTYIDTDIRNFSNYNNIGMTENFSGNPFPFTSKFSGNVDGEYVFPAGGGLNLFVGGTATYQSTQRSALGAGSYWDIPSYTLVDFRAGVETEDRRIKGTVFIRNAFDQYHWVNAYYALDTFVRLAGRPRTFGVSVSYRFGG